MSETKENKGLLLRNIHTDLKPVYDYIMKLHDTPDKEVMTTFQTTSRMNKRYCVVMMRALPILQKYAKHFEYDDIRKELTKPMSEFAFAKIEGKDNTTTTPPDKAQMGFMICGMIDEFRQCRYIDTKFNTNVQKHSLAFPDIDQVNFGIKATTDQETIERFRMMLDRSWTDEGFIDVDGNFYYVGDDHLLTLNWLEQHKISTMNFIRIANPSNGYFYITNGKDEKTAMQITRKQAKALVTIYRIMKMKRANMQPLSASLFTKSENLGFDKPQHIGVGIKNAQTISAYASSEEFDYEEVMDALREVKSTGRPPVLKDFIVR